MLKISMTLPTILWTLYMWWYVLNSNVYKGISDNTHRNCKIEALILSVVEPYLIGLTIFTWKGCIRSFICQNMWIFPTGTLRSNRLDNPKKILLANSKKRSIVGKKVVKYMFWNGEIRKTCFALQQSIIQNFCKKQYGQKN